MIIEKGSIIAIFRKENTSKENDIINVYEPYTQGSYSLIGTLDSTQLVSLMGKEIIVKLKDNELFPNTREYKFVKSFDTKAGKVVVGSRVVYTYEDGSES